jgi:streptogramin lyase
MSRAATRQVGRATAGSPSNLRCPTPTPTANRHPRQRRPSRGSRGLSRRSPSNPSLRSTSCRQGSRPHDVEPAPDGRVWYTGQRSGELGVVDPETGEVRVVPLGERSLAGSYIARIAHTDGAVEVVDVPTPDGGARRIWSDSGGRLWVTEWFAGNLARYDPASPTWQTWRRPGDHPQPYAVYVDEDDTVWVTDFGADALLRFDPARQQFRSYPWPTPGAQVRQLLGRRGEVWGAGSAIDKLIVLRTR